MPRRGSLVGDAYIRIWADTGPMKRALHREMATLGDDEADNYLTHFGDRIDQEADLHMRRAHQSLARALATGDFDAMWKKSGMSVTEFSDTVRVKLGEIDKEAQAGRISWNHYSESLQTLEHWQGRASVAERKLANEVGSAARNLHDGETRLGRFTNKIRLASDHMDVFARSAGRAFGKGSRNNFLNFVGTVVQGLASGLTVPFKALFNLIDGFHDLGAQFSDLRAGGSSLASALGQTLGPALLNVSVALVAVAVAVGITAFALPLLISLMFELVGAVTAVVGAIAVGLAGALLPLGPIILAAVAGMTPLIFFLRDLKKKVPAAVVLVKSLQINFDRLAKKVRPAMEEVATKTIALFDGILKASGPFISRMARMGAEIVSSLKVGLDSPTTKRFLHAFSTTLPQIFRSLGFGLNELGLALIAFFKPILPFALKLADNFNSLMTRFREWADSGKGQNSIAHFMEVAWSAAGRLWHILTTVFSILTKVFLAGTEGPGQDFLKWLDDTLTKFDTWLSTPAGKTAMEGFFDRVRTLMGDVKTIVENVALAIAKLSDPETQKQLNDLFTALSTVAGFMSKVADALLWINSLVVAQVSAYKQAFDAIVASIAQTVATIRGSGLLGAVTVAVTGVYTTLVKPFADGLFTIAGRMRNIWAVIINAGWRGAAAVAVTGIAATIGAPFITGYHTVSSWIASTAQRIRNGGFLSSAIAVGAGVAAALGSPIISGYRIVSGWISNIRSAISGGGFRSAAAGVMSGVAAVLIAPFAVAWNTISGIISSIRAGIQSIIDLANRIPIIRNLVPGTASGGVFNGPTKRLIGEAGPEAVVPLNRPLSMVDPSVRWLSAIAQGKGGMASGGVVTPGRTLVISPGAIQVNTIAQDPQNVARAMLDRLVTAIA